MDPMLGMVFMVPWSWAPMDYVRCTGQQMNLQQYAALYSLIGTIYGGNGSTTFNVPNLQCRMPMGSGQGTIGTGVGVLNVGQTGGAFVSTLNQANVPFHTHTSTFTSGGAGGTTTITGTASLPFSTTATLPATVSGDLTIASAAGGGVVTPANNSVLTKGGAQANIYLAGTANIPIGPTQTLSGTASGSVSGTASGPITLTASGGTGGGTVTVGPNVNGGSTPFSTVSPYLALNFIIAVNGLYPSRN
ncbi:phage tail protein [Azospirillum sp. INR13]|uniref:phage tail protein n=1 Tax=Azospirillum sp. INR13 TaxID=2596919 RepID=UPI0021038664|nr:tail fiber protein [Azospirillum sp. INR13]